MRNRQHGPTRTLAAERQLDSPCKQRLGGAVVDQLDYVALALHAEGRAEVSDSSEIADSWRKLAETYRLLAGHLAKKNRRQSTHPTNRKSEDDTTSGDDYPRQIW
jgi:hypothetical protein